MSKKDEMMRALANDNAAKWFLKTPDRTSKQFIDYVEWVNSSRKLDYGCILDKHLTPPLPGDYITVMARPGHKKSTLMAALAKRYALQISADNRQDEVVIYATWDEAVENVENYITAGVGGYNAGDVAWGRLPTQRAIQSSIKRVGLLSSLWVWGVSIMDKDYSKPPFTADWLFDTVQATKQKYGVTVKALFLDYLQIIPVAKGGNRTETVTAASTAAKMLAKEIGCPVFAGVQAGRAADSNADKMPGWSDAQHASAIEQDSTKQLALMNPIKVMPPEQIRLINSGAITDSIDVAGQSYKVDTDLTIVRILKQRGAIGAGTFAIGIDKNTLDIYDPEPGWQVGLNA